MKAAIMKFATATAFGAVFLGASTTFAGGGLPVQGQITSGVGWRVDPFGSGKMVYHRGIDIAVATGTSVFATSAGTVVFAGTRRAHGHTVIVRHHDGSETLYGHNSRVLVTAGQKVDGNTALALSGSTGRSTGPHVHYEVLREAVPGAAVIEVASVVAAPAPLSRSIEAEEKIQEIMDHIRNTIYGHDEKPLSAAAETARDEADS